MERKAPQVLHSTCGYVQTTNGCNALTTHHINEDHMVNLKGKPVELRVPSRMGYEKVAMGTAASVAKLMGFPDHRIEDLKTAIA
jgi:hypothetical protein